jgi:hypothetical protein
MKRSKAFLRSSSVPIVVFAVLVLFLSIGAARKSGSQPGNQDWTQKLQSITPRVQNKTRSFEITRARQNRGVSGSGPELSLRNGYDKNITAFAVSVNGLIALSDFVYSESEDGRAIAQGAVYTRWFGNVRRSAHRPAPAQEDFDIEVLAVVFDDKSSDGDKEAIGFLLDQRLKSKRLLTRVVDLLNEDLDSSRTSDDTMSAELRSRISSLSDDPSDSSDINDVLRWISQTASGLSSSERTVQVKEICENLISRL